ncbi:BF3164 family lipoprotein [Chryseobacterium echinoideorum]|uniref:BF3164 family lipoprotein n=1 Tax=Chryseobacterium echinoideorum TaxID=1549648 RepID=UPI001184F2D1|nr:BF3164 family lipoprotein [Chryseobacterium echinoideorum]
MKYISNFVYVLILLILFNCKQSSDKYVEFKIQDKSNSVNYLDEDRTQHITLKPTNIQGIFTDIAVVDSLLICGNLRSEKLINIYSLNSNKLINKIISRGNAQNEGLSIANIFVGSNRSVWIYDITLSKLFQINIDSSKNIGLIQKEISLAPKLKNIVSPSIINDSLVLATTYSFDDFRYLYTDFNKIKKKVGKLPDITNDEFLEDQPNTKFPNRAYIFKAISIKHPIDNKVAIFYNKTNRAEFYSNDKLSQAIHYKSKFNPKMYVTKLKKGFSVEDYAKTIYAYLSVAHTKDRIYCLFSGDKNGNTSSDKILVYDWEGNFINELSLDRKVSKICINPITETLYCYDDQIKSIFSIQVKF